MSEDEDRCDDLTKFPGGYYRCILPATHTTLPDNHPDHMHRVDFDRGDEGPKWVDLHGICPDFGETEGMELDRLRKQVAEYERLISWDVTCSNCANLLDSSYAETMRAEKAEAQVAAVRALVADGSTAVGFRATAAGAPVWTVTVGQVEAALAVGDGTPAEPTSPFEQCEDFHPHRPHRVGLICPGQPVGYWTIGSDLTPPSTGTPAEPTECEEFIETGRCGHSDSEHDAMADGNWVWPTPPSTGAALENDPNIG